ncbi:MAG: hypothetical protein M1572_01925 [Gammaproteobacteria bacterium]|nr:hypothetical protein [Gammaproteobacteria bacterium]HQT03430.1 hypothetical protein [Thiotrichales bacterium]
MDAIPVNANHYLPLLKQEQLHYWPGHHHPSLLAGQVEKESCVTLKSKKCWSPTAELKTSREWGVGLSQFTKTATFDAIEEIKAKHPQINWGNWGFNTNPYQAQYQLRALVVYMRDISTQIKNTHSIDDNYRMALSAYNGGLGGLRKDRLKCSMTPNCNPAIWYGHVERTSIKSKKPIKGYGQSFFDINRGYIRQVYQRAQKYEGRL